MAENEILELLLFLWGVDKTTTGVAQTLVAVEYTNSSMLLCYTLVRGRAVSSCPFGALGCMILLGFCQNDGGHRRLTRSRKNSFKHLVFW